jgi:folate-binding protein YgfZ
MSDKLAIGETLTHDRAGETQPQEVAPDYGDWQAEYWALRREAGLVPLADYSEIVLTGSDRGAFLNRLCTNRVDRLEPGRGAEALLTDAKAHVLAHVLVFAESDRLVLASLGRFGQRIASHLDYYLIREKVDIRDHSTDVTAFVLAGPRAVATLAGLGITSGLTEHLEHTSANLGGSPVDVRTLLFSVKPWYLLVCHAEAAAELRTALRQAGAKMCGHRAFEALRIEAGWPLYGIDITEANLPQELARDRQTLSFTKGCYLGQETVARLDSRGHVNKTLVGLTLPGEEPPPAGTPLTIDGEPVGQITSAARSPATGGIVALGYVRRGRNTPDAQLACDFGPATVVTLPMRHLDE